MRDSEELGKIFRLQKFHKVRSLGQLVSLVFSSPGYTCYVRMSPSRLLNVDQSEALQVYACYITLSLLMHREGHSRAQQMCPCTTQTVDGTLAYAKTHLACEFIRVHTHGLACKKQRQGCGECKVWSFKPPKVSPSALAPVASKACVKECPCKALNEGIKRGASHSIRQCLQYRRQAAHEQCPRNLQQPDQ